MPDFMSCTKAAAKSLHRGIPTALLFLGSKVVRLRRCSHAAGGYLCIFRTA